MSLWFGVLLLILLVTLNVRDMPKQRSSRSPGQTVDAGVRKEGR